MLDLQNNLNKLSPSTIQFCTEGTNRSVLTAVSNGVIELFRKKGNFKNWARSICCWRFCGVTKTKWI